MTGRDELDGAQDRAGRGASPLGGGWLVWLATGAWLGLVPWAPGTVGALWGLPLAWGISRIPHLSLQVLVILALCIGGIPLCTRAARTLGQKDPGAVVWDEIASLPIVFFLVDPQLVSRPSVLATGFVLHRVFDIAKPPPIRRLERLPEGLGVMADDWVAAAYASLVLHLALWLRLVPWGGW